ncbi:MAG: hypothetical protein QOJ39_6 [Candidatus Eremiobacteraeota bacterium]|nr:hypothetical protein [Candidatus Eremiobacteraeota bacterium]MEA2718142.1 hypothetical protein [Candidatus Eremiobacteraeota bacterium]
MRTNDSAVTWAAIRNDERAHAALAGLLTVVALGVVSGFHATAFNNFVWLADAWLHGKPYLPHFPGDYIDAIPYHGRAYVYQAPLPAVLMLPFVAIWGLDANETAVSIVLAGVGMAAAWRVARLIGLSRRWTALMVAFMLFGTSYAYCAADGSAWFIAHSGAVAFTMLALAECLGSRVPWRVALWALCAAFCRYPMILAFPAYAVAVWPQIRARPVRLAGVAAVGALFAIPSALYNYVRWGTIADVGFTKFYRIMDQGKTDPAPPFALKNLGMQLQFYFLEKPRVLATPPYLVAGQFGTALTFTSPALLLAFLAPIRERAVQLLWFATACCAIPALLYYSTGMVQLGARHALDFIPFLYALMAYAIRARPSPWYVPLFAWSILFGIIELAVWTWAPKLVYG